MSFVRQIAGALRITGALLATCVVTASAGEVVPARIVSLAPSITETIFALGEGDRLVGVTNFCDWPPAARSIERVGSYLEPNVEVVVALQPDLVIVVPSPGNHDEVRAIEDLGIEILIVAEGPRLDDVFRSLQVIGARIGHMAKSDEIVRGMKLRLAALRERFAGRALVPTLLVVDHDPFVVVGEPTLLDELVSIAGGRNVARGLGPWPRVSIEFLVKENPEVIIDGSAMNQSPGGGSFYEGLGLRAARAGRIRVISVDEVMRPGPRIIDGVETLAREIHAGAPS